MRRLSRALALLAAPLLVPLLAPLMAPSALAAPPASVAPAPSVRAEARPALTVTAPLDATTALATLQRRFGPQSRLGLDADKHLHALRRLEARLDPALPVADAVAQQFARNRDLFGLPPVVAATHEETLTLPQGAGQTLRFSLSVSGVPLERRSLAARLMPDGRLAELRMDPLPRQLLGGATPTLSPEAASARAGEALDSGNVGAPTLVFHVANPSVGRLAWRVPVAPVPLARHTFVWLDAHDGAVLETRDATLH
jgi:hypothetical protein